MAKYLIALLALAVTLAMGLDTPMARAKEPDGFVMKQVSFPKLDKSALRQLTNRAEQGDFAAQLELAKRHHLGQSVPRDTKKYKYWLHKAAQGGYYQAQEILGTSYAIFGFGDDNPPNYQEGLAWLILAKEHAPTERAHKIDAFIQIAKRELDPAQIEAAERRADMIRAHYKK